MNKSRYQAPFIPTTCQWISENGKTTGSCNATVVADRSYCNHHLSRVYTVTPRSIVSNEIAEVLVDEMVDELMTVINKSAPTIESEIALEIHIERTETNDYI